MLFGYTTPIILIKQCIIDEMKEKEGIQKFSGIIFTQYCRFLGCLVEFAMI